MQANLFPEERQQVIVKLLAQKGRVAVSDLSRRFGVSEVTIRSDLQTLADHNLVVRTHGGAVSANRLPDISLTMRRQQQVNEKEQIGIAAAQLVQDGSAIFLDTSSTALKIVPALSRKHDLTVVTNSLAIAQALLEVTGITTVMPGGILQRDTVSLIDVAGLEFLQRFNIRMGFFGAHGLTMQEGLTDVSAAEAEVKRELVKMCHQVIAILDSTKFGRVGLASFASVEDLAGIVTDKDAPDDMVEALKSTGVEVTIA